MQRWSKEMEGLLILVDDPALSHVMRLQITRVKAGSPIVRAP
jgi:hypothetical protein